MVPIADEPIADEPVEIEPVEFTTAQLKARLAQIERERDDAEAELKRFSAEVEMTKNTGATNEAHRIRTWTHTTVDWSKPVFAAHIYKKNAREEVKPANGVVEVQVNQGGRPTVVKLFCVNGLTVTNNRRALLRWAARGHGFAIWEVKRD